MNLILLTIETFIFLPGQQKKNTQEVLKFDSFNGLTDDAKIVLLRNFPSRKMPDWNLIE